MADLGEIDFNAFFDDAVAEADVAFDGLYKTEIKTLLSLSHAEIDAITPGDTTDLETYERLMAIVRTASKNNIDQAALISRIKDLGDVAISIGKKVPGWGHLLP